MQFDKLLDQLQENFNLKKNHILILKSLQFANIDAKQITKETKIPLGRIYSFLNELIQHQLIEKSKASPALYSCKNFEDKIITFLHENTKNLIKNKTQILTLLEDKNSDQFQLIDSSEKYTFELIDLLANGTEFKISNRNDKVTWELHPLRKEDLLLLLNETGKKGGILSGSGKLSLMLWKSYQQAWQERKKFIYVETKSGVDFQINILNKLFTKKIRNEIKAQLHKFNAAFYFNDESRPYSLFLSPKKMIFVLIGSNELVTGFSTMNKNVINVYERLFDDTLARSKRLLPYFCKKI